MPTPLNHAVFLSVASTLATLAGCLISPERGVVSTVLATLAAAVCYVGAAVAAVIVGAPRVQAPPRLQLHVARFASAAAMPALASGMLNIIPLGVLGFMAALGGAGMSYWSGLIGARDLLGLEGAPRQQAALVVSVCCGAPVVGCAMILWAL